MATAAGSSVLKGRTALITGCTRGIGRILALQLAELGVNIVVTGKTTEPTEKLPGTIYTVADEVEAAAQAAGSGATALPMRLDVLNDADINDVVQNAAKEFGTIDILVNNASALWWKPIEATPIEKYDLITTLNSRGTFATTKAVLPYMRESGWGHVLCQSPPIVLDSFAGKTAYNISKFGMTMTALGVAAEYKGMGIAGNSIWPNTLIESQATINHSIGKPELWRKPEVLTDAIVGILEEDPNEFSGNMLVDEDYLRQYKGVEDFSKYQCVPGKEPPSIWELEKHFGKMMGGSKDGGSGLAGSKNIA